MQSCYNGFEDRGALLSEVAAILGDAACLEAEATAFSRAVQAMLAGDGACSSWIDEAEPSAGEMDVVEEPAAVTREAEEVVVGALELQHEAERGEGENLVDAGQDAVTDEVSAEPGPAAVPADPDDGGARSQASDTRRPAGRGGAKRSRKGSR